MAKYTSRLYDLKDLSQPSLKIWRKMISAESYMDALDQWNISQILECLFRENLLLGSPGLVMGPKELIDVLIEHNAILNDNQPGRIQRDALSYVVKMKELHSFLRQQKSELKENTSHRKFSFFCTTWLFAYLSIEQGLEFIHLIRKEYLYDDAPIIFTITLNNEEDFYGVDIQEYVTSKDLVAFLEMLETTGMNSDLLADTIERNHNSVESVFVNISRFK